MIPKAFRSGSALRSVLSLATHLFRDYGWLRSFREGKCIDRHGNPIPWFTYPAIDFISQLDFSGRSVFEYGAGYSTLFWAGRAGRVVSVESEREWYDKIRTQAPPNCELIFSSREVNEYSSQILKYQSFDVIVVDGTGESRPLCCERALQHIKPGGMIILDNADLWLQSAALLRNAGLIQADFTGFAPLSVHAHTTSIFFTRQYDLQPLQGHQPHKSAAQPAEPWPGV